MIPESRMLPTLPRSSRPEVQTPIPSMKTPTGTGRLGMRR
jgi:hypothetical protein